MIEIAVLLTLLGVGYGCYCIGVHVGRKQELDSWLDLINERRM